MKKGIKRGLKITAIVATAIVAIVLLAISCVVWYLTPERLTPLATGFAREYLLADVKASRIELTFWGSFPKLTVEVDDLEIVSKTLSDLSADERAMLPSDADSLLSVRRFAGSVNLLKLATGVISVYDVEIANPRANLVAFNDTIVNYAIVPPSEEKEVESEIPSIEVRRFAITGGFPIRYFSLRDSIDMRVAINNISLEGEDVPVYKIDVSGAGAGALAQLHLPEITFGANGGVKWDYNDPYRVVFEQFDVRAGNVGIDFDADLTMSDTLLLNGFELRVPDLKISDAIALIPDEMKGELAKLNTDLMVNANVRLLKPYGPTSGTLPDAKVAIEVPKGQLSYDRLQINELSMKVAAMLRGNDLNASEVDLEYLKARGRAVGFDLKVKARNLIADPIVKGEFHGSVNLGLLPKQLLKKLQMTVSGRVRGDADFDTHLSYLTAKQFHKVKINGELTLSDLRLATDDGSMDAYARNAAMKFGSSSMVRISGHKVDSMLTVSANIDTVNFRSEGMHLASRKLQGGVGVKNLASSLDSTQVNPLGAQLRVEMLSLRSDSDSVRVRLRDVMIGGGVQRYKSDSKAPLVKAKFEAARASYRDAMNRLSVRECSGDLTLHPKSRRKMSGRMKAVYDSLAVVHPTLSGDSLARLAARTMRGSNRRHDKVSDGREMMDFGLDNSMRGLLQRWHAEGSLKAKRVRMFTPYFPVKNRVENLDMDFSTDSVLIHDTRLLMGKSDFLINGAIRNISRAMTSRRGSPIKIDFDIKCDTIDVNDISEAIFAGSDFAEKVKSGEVKLSDADSDEQLQKELDAGRQEASKRAFVVPSNIEATLRVRARRMLYADIWFQRFQGNIAISDGAVNLRRLGAFTPMGSLDVTALYSAPTINDVSLAAGLVVRKLNLKEFLHMIPQLDTVMPMLRNLEGIVSTEVAMTTELDSVMDFKFNTLNMMLKIEGDSLVLLDHETFRKIGKWLLFKHKDRNVVDRIQAELMIKDSRLDLFPFLLDIDRYRLGISGNNDARMNLDYHVAVLKSPIPFKFGINIKGTPDHLKIRLGRARFNENKIASSRQLTDTARINLLKEIESVFRFGVRSGKQRQLMLTEPKVTREEFNIADTLTYEDSVMFIQQGIIERPEGFLMPGEQSAVDPKKQKKDKKKKK